MVAAWISSRATACSASSDFRSTATPSCSRAEAVAAAVEPAETADTSISVEYRQPWPETLGLYVLGEPVERIFPGGQGLVLDVARAGVVVEGVLRARIRLELVGDVGGLQRRLEVVLLGV